MNKKKIKNHNKMPKTQEFRYRIPEKENILESRVY